MRPVDLNALVQLTLRLRAYSLRVIGTSTSRRTSTRRCRELSGDEQKLQQVMLNLIVNAEYAMRRRADASASSFARRARATSSSGSVGHGRAACPRTRCSASSSRSSRRSRLAKARGSGSSVSYGIVEAHGGTITVDSAPGRGTTFRIVLPIPRAYAQPRGRLA